MALFKISLNQLIEASRSTPNGKQRIIRQQLDVNKTLTSWYQLAKNRIKKYFLDVQNVKVLDECINILKNRIPKDDKDKSNIKVSIEAVQKVKDMHFNEILVDQYEVVKIKSASLEFEEIIVNISPDLIYRITEDGVKKVGALKFRVSKTKPFDLRQSKLIANLLKSFLSEKIASIDEIVDEKLCWSYDVFTDRLVYADANEKISKEEILILCKELKDIYNSIESKRG